jgi:glycosyltransferase involved in cell wall biosynthesis
VTLEALSCEKAFVSTDTTGVREVVRDGVNGILVPQGDAHSLGRALVRLIRDPTLRRAMGRQARALVVDRFTWSRAVDEYEALYRRLMSRRADAIISRAAA